jgi:hypothetical protein
MRTRPHSRYHEPVRRLAAATAMLAMLVPRTAVAGPGEHESDETAEVGELSEQGTRRGSLEIGLGVLLTGTAGGLIAFGTVQFIRAREHVEFCQQGVTYIDELDDDSGGIDPCVFDPPPLGFASAGLSWGLSIPLAVGAGMLFARARRMIVDARRYDRLQMTLVPWWQRDGGGAALTLRF